MPPSRSSGDSMNSHQLQKSWAFLYWSNADWKNITTLYEIDTIEDFWRVYNNVPKLCEIPGANFAFFVKGIPPIWEHKENRNGGKWLWDYPSSWLSREAPVNNMDDYQHNTDHAWLRLLLLLIGHTLLRETRDAPSWHKLQNEICGASVHTRRGGDRMALWTRSTDSNLQWIIGNSLSKHLAMASGLQFKAHQDAISANSCFQTCAKLVFSKEEDKTRSTGEAHWRSTSRLTTWSQQVDITRLAALETSAMPRPTMARPVVERPVVERPVVERPVVERPVARRPVVERPVARRPVVERPVVERPVVERPVTRRPVVERPVTRRPVVERPVVERPFAARPVTRRPVSRWVNSAHCAQKK